MKFCRVFDISDEDQVLLQVVNDPDAERKSRLRYDTDIDGLHVEFSLGPLDPDLAYERLLAVTVEDVIRQRAELEVLLLEDM